MIFATLVLEKPDGTEVTGSSFEGTLAVISPRAAVENMAAFDAVVTHVLRVSGDHGLAQGLYVRDQALDKRYQLVRRLDELPQAFGTRWHVSREVV